jgi:hypothetical protein
VLVWLISLRLEMANSCSFCWQVGNCMTRSE